MQENTTKTVPAADWDAGKFSKDEWELVQYRDYYMGLPKFAEIRRWSRYERCQTRPVHEVQ